MLPHGHGIEWGTIVNPYRRSYSRTKKAVWESNDNYCVENVFQDTTYHSRRMLDLMDMTMFDFLAGNQDRHHYEFITSLGSDTFPLHYDNGRSFGRALTDELSILAPVIQCCFIRYSTFNGLKYLYENKLSKLMDDSLKNDPLYPILTKSHLTALDRRLTIIFNALYKCSQDMPITQIVVDDGY